MTDEINMNKLAISDGNTLPNCEATDQEDYQPFQLFDLPREIRDRIYEFVLIPEIPIEFAPLIRGNRHESFWTDCNPDENAQRWYLDHYRKVQATLVLLRANKQINSEATPIFYGQPFRFSNQSGWLILYHWMEFIGGEKRDMIKDITICHPSFMTFPKSIFYARCAYDEFGVLAFTLGTRDLFEEKCPYQPVRSKSKIYHEGGDCCGPEIDPVAMISRLPSLRNLRLILTCTQRADLWANSPGLHPIFDVDTPVGLKIQAISLINYYYPYHYCPQPSNIIEHIATELGTITNCDGYYKHVVGFQAELDPYEARTIQKAYTDMRDKNVELIAMLYDKNGTFPVFPNMDCANKDLCDYLRSLGGWWYDHEIVDGVCCGTKDERNDYAFAV